jgi:sporulation protein YlmC with PRC-barrel domain
MKQPRSVIALLSIMAMLLASAAFATSPAGSAATESPAVGVPVHKASTFIGSKVENPQGDSLGTISDIVLEPNEGRIRYVALSYGGVLGLGGKLFAIPWNALTLRPDGKTFLLNVDKQLLETAPGFNKDNWPQRPDATLQAAIRAPAGAMPTGADARPERPAASMVDTRTERMVSGTIADLDLQRGSFTLKTSTGETIDLVAPSALLAGLAAGDVVEVSRAGKVVTTISKKNGQ